jgi:hypothetical protein
VSRVAAVVGDELTLPPPAETPAAAGEGIADADLLRRHRPWLLWDSQDDYRALSATSIVSNSGNTLRRDKQVLAGVNGEGGRDLSLDLLAAGSGLEALEDDCIAEAPAPLTAARLMQADARFANQVYGRCKRGGNAIWLQYWLWLYYNPKALLGFGRHEGDWEMVQIALHPTTLEPTAVTYSQHGRGEVKEKDRLCDVEWRSCEPACTSGCRHPVAFVAPFSHASYFEAGTHLHPPITDNPDGACFDGLPEVQPFGPWSAWPGHWGGSTSRFSTSPRSPECQGDQWSQARFQEKGRRRKRREERLMWRLGRATFPSTPLIESAVSEGDTIVIDWRVEPSRWWRQPRWILLTVESTSKGRLLAKRVIRASGPTGHTRIPITTGQVQNVAVRTSAFNRIRQRSDSSPAHSVSPGTIPDRGVPRARDDWSPRVWKWFCHAVLDDLISSGAASFDELERRRVSVLDLALDRIELTAVLEHARRTGLLEAKENAHRADGTTASAVEWAPSENARLSMGGPLKWALSIAGAIPSALLIGVLSLLFKDPVKDLADHHLTVLVFLGLVTLELLAGGILVAHRYLGGASPREIAHQWSRHAVEQPGLNRWHQGRVNSALLALALAGSVTLEALVAWDVPTWVLTAGYAAMLVSQLVLASRFAAYRNMQLEAAAALEHQPSVS